MASDACADLPANVRAFHEQRGLREIGIPRPRTIPAYDPRA